MGDVELGEERANQFTDYSFLILNVDLNMVSTLRALSYKYGLWVLGLEQSVVQEISQLTESCQAAHYSVSAVACFRNAFNTFFAYLGRGECRDWHRPAGNGGVRLLHGRRLWAEGGRPSTADDDFVVDHSCQTYPTDDHGMDHFNFHPRLHQIYRHSLRCSHFRRGEAGKAVQTSCSTWKTIGSLALTKITVSEFHSDYNIVSISLYFICVCFDPLQICDSRWRKGNYDWRGLCRSIRYFTLSHSTVKVF